MFDHWKDLLHPHEGNDHHPHAYRKASAIALACVVGIILLVSALQTGYVRQSSNFLSSVLPSVLVEMTNENRLEQDLGGLQHNDTLAKAAKLKAEHMAENSYFAHDSPSGITPWHWFQEAGYTYDHAGENLAMNFSDSQEVVEAWMESRLHRENILEEDFTEIGIATARGEYQGKETIFVVQMFGTPDERELAQRQASEPAEATTQEQGDQQNDEPATSTEELVAELSEQVQQVQEDVQTQESVDGQQADSESRELADAESASNEQEQTSDQNQQVQQATTSTEQSTTSTTSEQESTTSSSRQLAQQTTSTQQPNVTATPTTAAGSVAGQSGISLAPLDMGWFNRLISQPQLVLQTAMYTLIGLILLVLISSAILEAKHHHFWLASLSLLAIALILLVYLFAQDLLFMETMVT